MKILVIDDHRLFLDGITMILEGFGHQVAACLSAQSAITELEKNRYELIFSDMMMPGLNGLALLRSLQERNISTPVIILSAHFDSSFIDEAIINGAKGYISKNSHKGIIQSAIEAVGAGKTFIPSELNYEPGDLGSKANSIDNKSEKISSRQITVIEYLNQGYSNKQIATAMNITEATVKTHLNKIFHVLSVKNRTSCAIKAKELGLI